MSSGRRTGARSSEMRKNVCMNQYWNPNESALKLVWASPRPQYLTNEVGLVHKKRNSAELTLLYTITAARLVGCCCHRSLDSSPDGYTGAHGFQRLPNAASTESPREEVVDHRTFPRLVSLPRCGDTEATPSESPSGFTPIVHTQFATAILKFDFDSSISLLVCSKKNHTPLQVLQDAFSLHRGPKSTSH